MEGLRTALPAAFLLLLLLSAAVAEQPPWPWTPGVMHPLNPSSHHASRAAWLALNYHNYHSASPSSLRALGQVLKATVKSIPAVGVKYYLHFTTEDYISGQNAGSCVATVLYLKNSRPAVNIKCLHTKDQNQIQDEDNRFHQQLRQQTKPIIANDIPDSHGNIDRALIPVWGLAVAGSSYVMLQKSTENLGYFMAQVKAVKQRIRKDNAAEFEFAVLLHETPTQKIDLCNIHVIWTLGHPLRVKYICASENHRLEDGSGMESGSASGILHEREGNF